MKQIGSLILLLLATACPAKSDVSLSDAMPIVLRQAQAAL